MSLVGVRPALVQIDPVPRISIQAFCESIEASAVVAEAAADRRMAKAQVKQNMGGAAAALEAYRNSATPNVIVVEAPADREALIAQLDELAHCCDSGTKVVVLGRTNDVSLYRQLMARGVSEYLVPPFDVVDFVEAISQLFRAPGAKPLGRIVSVIGSKGGVGASTVAHNLAWSLASIADKATIIADFDLAFGTAGLDYNQDPAQGVADAVFAPERVDAVLVDRLLARCGDHLSLLAAPATLDRALDFSDSAFDTLIDAMRASTPWIVVDLPHQWSGWVRRTLIASDDVIVVAGPDLANLRNAKNLIDLLKAARPHDHPPRMVLNGVGMPRRPEIAVAEFAKTVEAKPVAIFPHDANLFGAAANNGQMIAEVEPKGKVAETFDELAALVAGWSETTRSRKSFLEPLMSALAWARG